MVLDHGSLGITYVSFFYLTGKYIGQGYIYIR